MIVFCTTVLAGVQVCCRSFLTSREMLALFRQHCAVCGAYQFSRNSSLDSNMLDLTFKTLGWCIYFRKLLHSKGSSKVNLTLAEIQMAVYIVKHLHFDLKTLAYASQAVHLHKESFFFFEDP